MSFCILLIVEGSSYGNANCSNVTVCIIYVLMKSIDKYLKKLMLMGYLKKMGLCLKKKIFLQYFYSCVSRRHQTSLANLVILTLESI